MGVRQGTLLGNRSLVSFLETTTVRHAAEDARNCLRIVHEAEAGENLVLVVDVEIHPGVESITVFAQLWRTR